MAPVSVCSNLSPRIRPSRLLGTLLVSTLIITGANVVFAHPASAQQSTANVSFSVPAGPLGQALIVWGRQAGVQVSYIDAVTTGKTTSGLSGNLAPEQALSRLLNGTGLNYNFSDARSVVITGMGTVGADGAMNLGTIRLSAGGLAGYGDTFETAGSVGYISGDDIVQNRGTSVGDFISGVPGVLNGDMRNSGGLDVNIRGMQGQGRVPVVIDGASQEQTVYRGYNGARSASYVDPDFISEVSIEKGPSAGPDAAGAIGGVVRMSTLSASDILLPSKTFGVRLRGGFNTNSTSVPDVMTSGGVVGGMFQSGQPSIVRDGGNMNRPDLLKPTGGNGSIAAAFTSENVDLVAAYAKRRNGNYFSGEHGRGQARLVDLGDNGYGWNVVGYEGLSPWKGGEEILNTSNDSNSTLLKGNFRITPDHAIELGYMRYQSTFGEIMPTRLGTHTNARGGFQSALDTLDLKTTTARYRWDPENDWINLRVDAYRTDMDQRSTSLLSLMGVTTQSLYLSRAVRDGVTVSNESRLRVIPGDFRLQYGGAWQREKVGLPKGKENDEWTINHLEFPPRTGDRTEKSGFVNADWRINPQWQVTGGLRYTDYNSRDQHYSLKSLGFWPNFIYELQKGQETQTRGHGLSKYTSISWTPVDDLQIYGRYSDAMRMPSIFESINGFSSAYLPSDLRPERARNFEIGVNKTFHGLLGDDRLRLHAAYYDNNIDDYLTRSNVIYPEPIGFQIGGLGMINLENARMKGIELAADYDRGPLSARLAWNHAITSRFCARPGTLHRQDELCTAGGFTNSYALQHVPPRDTISMQLGYRLMEDKLSVGTRVNYYSNRITQTTVASTSEIQPGKWKPYTIVDLFASYKFNEARQIDFAIDNVTDRYYMDALNAALMPAPGRTIRVNFTAKF